MSAVGDELVPAADVHGESEWPALAALEMVCYAVKVGEGLVDGRGLGKAVGEHLANDDIFRFEEDHGGQLLYCGVSALVWCAV